MLTVDDSGWINYRRTRLGTVIGDGLTRRCGWNHNLDKIKTTVVNRIAPVTDDKGITYRYVQACFSSLPDFDVVPLRFEIADSLSDLIKTARDMLGQLEGIVIKFSGGSSSAGIVPIHSSDRLEEGIVQSLLHYGSSKLSNKTVFPATVCELVNPHLASFQGKRRVFDLRVNYARTGNRIVPAGACVRLARMNFDPREKHTEREMWITNITGFGGLEHWRCLAVNRELLGVLQIDYDFLVQCLSAGSVLLAHITNNYSNRAAIPDIP